MANPVVIDFLVKGMPDVQRALRGVEAAAAAAERAASRQAQREAAKRVQLAEKEAKEKERAVSKWYAGAKREQERASRDAAKAVQAGVRAEERAAREKIRIMQRVDAEHRRIQDRAERDTLRAHERETRSKEREGKRLARITERDQKQQHAETIATRERFARAIGRGVMTAGSAVVRGATAMAGAVGQLGGGFSIVDSLGQGMKTRGKLADVANRGLIAGDPENSKRRSVDDLQSKVNAVGIQYGIDPDKGADALDKFGSKTGNLARGEQLLAGLAEMSRAGAGSLDDLADAAGDVFNADKTQSAEQVLSVMRALAGAGRLGAIEMKDLASQMAALGASAGRFQGDAGKNMAVMSGLAQLSRESGGSKSAAQATTAVQSLTNQFYKGARLKAFAGLGVETKDEKGFNRNIDDVLIETMLGAEKKSREGGHGMKDFDRIMGTAIADAQARRATTPLEKAFKEAGGGEAGAKAARARLAQFSGATMTKEEVTNAARERMKETDAQLEQAFIELRTTVGRELTPELMKMIPVIRESIPVFRDLLHALVRLAEYAKENPFAGLGAFFTAMVAKEVIAAQIGETLKRVITGGAGAAGPSVPGLPGGGGGVGGGASAAALGLGPVLAVAAGAAIQTGMIGADIDRVVNARSAGNANADALAEMAKNGQGDAARAGLAKAQEDSSAGNWAMAAVTGASKILNYTPPNMLAQLASNKVQTAITGKDETAADSQMTNTIASQFTASSDKLVAALEKNAAATEASAGANGNPNGGPRVAPINAR